MSQTSRQLHIDHYRSGDETDIFALNDAEYGPTHVMVTPEAFRWRYAKNPSGSAEITVVRDAATTHVVGFTWAIPIRMRLFKRDCLAILTANQLVHPDYRDSLAYPLLLRRRLQLLHKLGVPFRFNFPTEAVYERAASVEKMSSFLIPLLVRPVNTVPLAKAYMKNRASNMIGWAGKILAPVYFHCQPPNTRSGPWKIEWTEQFDNRFDDLWERVKDKYAIMTIRDNAFLSWRFAPVAGRSYRILTASFNNQLVGYLVVRCTDEIRQIPIGLIMDFLLEPGSRGEEAGQLLLAEAWKYFQTEKVWLAGGLAFSHTVEYKILYRSGYRSLKPRFNPRLFRVAFNCFGDFLPETACVKPENMFITIADYEAH